jgi:cytochrome c-type biogenesis protein CcmH
MTWIAVIGLAVLSFAGAALMFRLDKALWTSLSAALGFGLAGYALQASPDMPSAPKSAAVNTDELEFDVVSARREFVAQGDRSGSEMLVVSDAMARRGRYAEAAQMLAGVTRENPLYSFQRASAVKPDHLAPGYFLGVSLLRQGRLMEARQVWRETLESAGENAEGRAGMEDRLARLDAMLGAMQSGQQSAPEAAQGDETAETGE